MSAKKILLYLNKLLLGTPTERIYFRLTGPETNNKNLHIDATYLGLQLFISNQYMATFYSYLSSTLRKAIHLHKDSFVVLCSVRQHALLSIS